MLLAIAVTGAGAYADTGRRLWPGHGEVWPSRLGVRWDRSMGRTWVQVDFVAETGLRPGRPAAPVWWTPDTWRDQ